MKGRFCFVGFDSAWTDNPKQRGAIAAAVLQDGTCVAEFEPRLATFNEALDFIRVVTAGADYILVALDQPTIVPNVIGMRPVEKVAGSIVNSRGGGVQPANRGRADMFGDGAPVWNFLTELNARQNPTAARDATNGKFLVEVFPALSLHAWLPQSPGPSRGPKYNPGNKGKFTLADWKLVCDVVLQCAEAAGLANLAAWVGRQGKSDHPRKCDQDCLDGAICLLLAMLWRTGPRESAICIGDATSGFIVTAVEPGMRAKLLASAKTRRVPVDELWPEDACHGTISTMPAFPSRPRVPSSQPIKRLAPAAPKAGKIVFDLVELRSLLVGAARYRRCLTYGEVANHFGYEWSQGAGSALNPALDALGAENIRKGEPLLMALVVSKSSGLPGAGFFRAKRVPPHNQRAAFEQQRDSVFAFHWS